MYIYGFLETNNVTVLILGWILKHKISDRKQKHPTG